MYNTIQGAELMGEGQTIAECEGNTVTLSDFISR